MSVWQNTSTMHLQITILIAISCMFCVVQSFICRDGIENMVGYVYGNERCKINEKACFQSVKCETIGDSNFKIYKWKCMDQKNCKNSTDGNSYAYYDGIRGVCCFTSECNAYKRSECTSGDAKIGLSKMAYVGFALVVVFLALKVLS